MNIIEAIRQAGVVGAGGAGFPTHMKLAVQAKRVLVNGAECEPLLRADQLAMCHQAARVVRGLELAMEAASAPEGVIVTKAHYHEAVEALRKELAEKPHITLHLMESYYPSGDEKNVIYEVTGQIVPTGKLPIDLGCVVINVGTAIGIADAVDGIPVTDKWVTLGGEVPMPMTVSVPIGSSMREVLKLSGFEGQEKDYGLIVGGPLMGTLAESWDAPVTKTTGGLLVFRRTHPLMIRRSLPLERQIKLARSICCQCNRCTQLCPRHSLGLPVEPHKAMRTLFTGSAASLGNAAGVLACSGCGLCTNFACEMGLAPSLVMNALKQALTAAGVRPVPEENLRPDSGLALKNVPVKRLMARMGLTAYDKAAPYGEKPFLPKEVTLMLRQHVGSPAKPTIKQGDRVQRGQEIASIPKNALGAALHASISGTVTQVTEEYIRIAGE